MGLGHHIEPSDEFLCSKLLDCFLKRRRMAGPNSMDLLNCLSASYSREFDREWRQEL